MRTGDEMSCSQRKEKLISRDSDHLIFNISRFLPETFLCYSEAHVVTNLSQVDLVT